jgi:hypothetical protein
MLAFTSVYFFETRLFKGLQPIQTKKILSPLRTPADPSEMRFRLHLSCRCISDHPFNLGHLYKDIAQASAFLKKLY